jgi:hypothetical protein
MPPAHAQTTRSYFKNNQTALGLLRYVIVNGIVPGKVLTPADFRAIGLSGIDTAVPGQQLQFNVSGTRIVTPGYGERCSSGRHAT